MKIALKSLPKAWPATIIDPADLITWLQSCEKVSVCGFCYHGSSGEMEVRWSLHPADKDGNVDYTAEPKRFLTVAKSK